MGALKIVRFAVQAVVFYLIILLAEPNSVAGAAPQQVGAPYSLTLNVTPPKLPADGKTYQVIVVSLVDVSGKPSLALTDTKVILTSSVESVGFVSPEVVIKAGKSFAVANFTTTNTPGVSVITASASGLQPFSAPIQTVTPSGFPAKLQVFPIPSTTLARPNSTGSLVIVIEDETGLPARAISDVIVTLSSSNTAVIGIPERSLRIEKGEFMGLSTYTSTFVTGSSFITVSASGFISGSASINVVGPVPLKLSMQAAPPTMVIQSSGKIVISLTDLDGRPARAPTDITVTLTSSNLTVASVEQSVVIKRGEMYATASYTTTSTSGSSVITASSPGLVSSFSTVKTYKRAPPTSLSLYIAPNPILADNTAYSAVIVALLNKTGYPAVSSSDILVTLTSSSSAVGVVDQTIVIQSGTNFATAKFKTTYLVGNSQITASAQGLAPAQAQISTFGPIPAQVSVRSAPFSLPADGGSYNALSIMLLDRNGSPAVSPTDVPVQLASSRPDVAIVNSTVVIPAGHTYTLVPIRTTVSPGSSNITASASGYSSSSTIVLTVSPAPSKLAVYVAPSQSILPLSGPTFFVSIQLQDSAGNPARARSETVVNIVSSNTTVFEGTLMIKIGVGSDFNSTFVSVAQGGSGTLTASSHGLGSSSIQVSILPLPLSIQLTSTVNKPFIYLNQTASFELKITLEGIGIRSVNVSWSSSGGTMSPSLTTTDEDGAASSTFSPSGPGEVTVSATIASPLIGTRKLSSSILVISPPEKPKPSLLSSILTYIPLIIVILFLALIIFMVRRMIIRRRRKAVEEEEEEAIQGSG